VQTANEGMTVIDVAAEREAAAIDSLVRLKDKLIDGIAKLLCCWRKILKEKG